MNIDFIMTNVMCCCSYVALSPHSYCLAVTNRDYYTIHGVCSIRVVILGCMIVCSAKSQMHRKLMSYAK